WTLRYIASIDVPSGAVQCCSIVRSPSVPVHGPLMKASWSIAAFAGGAEPMASCATAGDAVTAAARNNRKRRGTVRRRAVDMVAHGTRGRRLAYPAATFDSRKARDAANRHPPPADRHGLCR